jgi:hypothetical protein
MAEKPRRASEYKSEQVELVRATCLYVATKLGDMMDDLVIVGGLVPSLIIDQQTLPADVAPHVGTMDLDVGLQIALLNEGRYRELTERLRDAGYGGGVDDVAAKLRPLLDDPDAQRGLAVLRRDFSELDAVGPMRVAAFVTGGQDDELQAEVVAFVAQLLAKVGAP